MYYNFAIYNFMIKRNVNCIFHSSQDPRTFFCLLSLVGLSEVKEFHYVFGFYRRDSNDAEGGLHSIFLLTWSQKYMIQYIMN